MRLRLSEETAGRLADLYRRMEEAYDQVAESLDFSCDGCTDNCCDSWFQHHTYSEWSYLWQGLAALDSQVRQAVERRARTYLLEAERAMLRDQRPQVMCPLNEEGRCILYGHRLMICRLHGVPARYQLPDGRVGTSQGCHRCRQRLGEDYDGPVLDRTPFYRELAELEQRFLAAVGRPVPRLRLAIAQMILRGEPEV